MIHFTFSSAVNPFLLDAKFRHKNYRSKMANLQPSLNNIDLNNSNDESHHLETSKLQKMGGEIRYTLDDAIEHIGIGPFQVKVIAILGLMWIADASETMILSIISPILKCEWQLTPSQEALITTVVFLGLSLGSFVWGTVSDKLGRKRGLYASGSIVLLFGAACAAVPSYPWLLFMRFIAGFGIGGIPQACTMITETFPIRYRGRASVGLEFFWALGSVFASAAAIIVVRASSWRYFLLVVASPVLFFLIAVIWLPESPRYLFTTGKRVQLMEVIERICKENKKNLPKGTLVEVELNEKRGNFFELLTAEWRRTTVLLLLIWFSSAFGYYGIVLLTTSIMQTGINGCHPWGTMYTNQNGTMNFTQPLCNELTTQNYVEFMWTTVAEIPGLVVALLLIERIGRRWSLAVLFGVAGVSFLSLAICTNKVASLASVFVVRGSMTGAFQLTFVYTAEVCALA